MINILFSTFIDEKNIKRAYAYGEPDSLVDILNSLNKLTYLYEVLEGIKNVEITREDFCHLEKEEMQRRYSYYDHMNTEERKSMSYAWQTADVWFMESFQNITTVQYGDVPDYEEYDTKEVLVVLEKWIAYLEEFYKDKKIIK